MIKNYQQKITNINDRISNYFINRDKIIDSNDIDDNKSIIIE